MSITIDAWGLSVDNILDRYGITWDALYDANKDNYVGLSGADIQVDWSVTENATMHHTTVGGGTYWTLDNADDAYFASSTLVKGLQFYSKSDDSIYKIEDVNIVNKTETHKEYKYEREEIKQIEGMKSYEETLWYYQQFILPMEPSTTKIVQDAINGKWYLVRRKTIETTTDTKHVTLSLSLVESNVATSVAEILESYGGSPILEPLSVIIPTKNSGGISPTYSGGEVSNNYIYSYDTESPSELYNQGLQKFDCYFQVIVDNQVQNTMYLPVYPNEVSDEVHAQFNATSILGRSVEYQTYNSSSRKLSFPLELHEELCSDPNYVHNIINVLQSACYPKYVGLYVQPPEVFFHIGSQFQIRGILSDISVDWKAPIIDGRLTNCSTNISIEETTGPYSISEVARMGGFRS